MLELYKPDMYKKDIYSIDYKKLKSYGIKCLLFDLDNTLVPNNIKKPSRKVKDFIERLKDMGFKVIIFSNTNKNRLTPFKKTLEVDCAASSRKPLKRKYKKVLTEYKYLESEVAMIGDQIVTDIYGGNRMGIFTVLIKPMAKNEPIWTKCNRVRENYIIKKMEKRNLFSRGKYYE